MNTDQKRIIEYKGMQRLYLETADKRMVEHPYGPAHSQAVGKIFRWASTVLGDASDADVAFVKNIFPNVFKKERISGIQIGQLVPITVLCQFMWGSSLYLLVKVDYSHNPKIIDLKGRDSTWLIIQVYLESAKRRILS